MHGEEKAPKLLILVPRSKRSLQDAQKALVTGSSLCPRTRSCRPRVATVFTHRPLVHPPARARSIAHSDCLALIHAGMAEVRHSMRTFFEAFAIAGPPGSHPRRTMHDARLNAVTLARSLHPGPPFRLWTYLARWILGLIPGAHFGATLARTRDPQSRCSLTIPSWASSAWFFLVSCVSCSWLGFWGTSVESKGASSCSSRIWFATRTRPVAPHLSAFGDRCP